MILLFRVAVLEDAMLLPAYRRETEQLHVRRVPLAIGLYLTLTGVSAIFDNLLNPEHLRGFLQLYILQMVVFTPLLVTRHELARRGWLETVNIATWCITAGLYNSYSVLTGMPGELAALGTTNLMIGIAWLMPWGIRGQAVVCGAALAGLAVALLVHPSTAVPPTFMFYGTACGAAIALFGARHFDLHRLALFCEATQREKQAAISQSLVSIAKEINDALDADDVLDRIAVVTRSALLANWSVIMLRDPSRDCFVVVGSSGATPEDVVHLRGIEFAAGAFPLVDRILREREVMLIDTATEPDTTALLQRWSSRSVLGTALQRRASVVGVLLAGTKDGSGHFSERGRELFRGIAQHVAIALSNVRLVGDLRRANELKSEFLSTMSHELRTPLNVIIGYTDLLRDAAFGPIAVEQQEVLDRMNSNAHALLELINSTLEVNRIEAGRSGVHMCEVELRDLLAELQLESEQLPRQSGVQLRWEVPRTAAVLRTDPLKLKIVVRNLIGNAFKFTKRGAVAVHVGFDPRAKTLDVAVRDTGAGIDPENLPKIFDMFHQAPSGMHRGGVGLGLYIVKRFVDLLGGHIEASSRLGEGSTFQFSLPAGVVAQPASLEEHRRRRSA